MSNSIEKPFVIFGGECFYPIGGWSDHKGQAATKDEAILKVKALVVNGGDIQWWHIIDVRNGNMVARSKVEPYNCYYEPDANVEIVE